ncbi:GntR family transcriptional regulator [Variovorax sp. CYS-02]|uniref:GntR family transcriptional regulator n=1 Tax=Variovorax terrae TaxID=2923278 RepID=A0A9X1VSE9_9BURK|nr:GntR family transcriptional regulator [Variovorax terrae]
MRKTAVELVVDELRQRILSGTLPPGSALRQEALAEELGVSRIPLREAMRFLSSEGLVDLQPHRGAFVSMLSTAEAQEFFDIRLRLEPWLLREAAPAMGEAELAQAEAVVTRMDVAEASDWGRLNWQLHELLYRPAQRPAALGIVRALHEKSERYLRFQVVNAPIRQQARTEHMALIGLCRHGQAEQAQAALEQHIIEAAEQIIGIVRRLLDESDGSPRHG